MGDEYRGALPRQAFCGVDGIGYKLGVHTGEGLVEQQRLCITAEQCAVFARRRAAQQAVPAPHR